MITHYMIDLGRVIPQNKLHMNIVIQTRQFIKLQNKIDFKSEKYRSK